MERIACAKGLEREGEWQGMSLKEGSRDWNKKSPVQEQERKVGVKGCRLCWPS